MKLDLIKVKWSKEIEHWANLLLLNLVKRAKGFWVIPGFILFVLTLMIAFVMITSLFLISDMIISAVSSFPAFKSWIYGAAIGSLFLYPFAGQVLNLSWWYSVVSSYPSSGPDPLACLKEYKYERYATAPNHEQRIQEILLPMGFMHDPKEIDEYIQRVAPGSPVRGYMVKNSADKYHVDPRLMLALMHADSHFGMYGKGARTKNPGNVGNDDSGRMSHKKSWDEGVEAVAKWLDKNRKTTASSLPGNIEQKADHQVGLFLFLNDIITSCKNTLRRKQKSLGSREE